MKATVTAVKVLLLYALLAIATPDRTYMSSNQVATTRAARRARALNANEASREASREDAALHWKDSKVSGFGYLLFDLPDIVCFSSARHRMPVR
jgi:hypothetical protein